MNDLKQLQEREERLNKAKQLRLDELLTWDKSNGNTWEHTAKVTALQNLLNDGKKLKP